MSARAHYWFCVLLVGPLMIYLSISVVSYFMAAFWCALWLTLVVTGLLEKKKK